MTDMTLMSLMCARICHDLVAPASAVSMGLEMLSQGPQNGVVHDLLNESAQSTLSKLETFRCLTGFADTQSKPTGADLKKALKSYWADHKISVTWDIGDLEKIQGGPARLLLATILTVADGLPRGGMVTVGVGPRIIAQGPRACLREDLAQALTGQASLAQQTASTIVGFFAHTLAHSLGQKIHIQTIDENQFQVVVH